MHAPLALRQVLRMVSRSSSATVELVAVRRPEVVLRRTAYAGVVAEERVLSRAFPFVTHSSRLQALTLLEGKLRFCRTPERAPLTLEPGDSVLLSPPEIARTRMENVVFVDVEWALDGPERSLAPKRLPRLDVGRARALGERLAADESPGRAHFAEAFSLFAGAGVKFGGLDAEGLRGGPSERDRRIAHAIGAQVADLRRGATELAMGELTELSPRQLQRVLAEFCQRYQISATSWRDLRNRYRVQFGIALLSVPELSVAAIAGDVGYGSAAAFARALANLGLPPPGELREEIARLAQVE